MTQVDRSQELRKEVRPGLTDNYTPAANVLIQGFPELSISERYVTIGLVSIYWDERVYPVSLRELATKIQIDHTALRSRGGKRPCEGILDKLWRLGIIGLMEGKPITELGNKGRVQTYIRVNHRYIAEQNQSYTLGKKVRTVRSITVENTNSTTEEPRVENDNDVVGDTNHTVGILNDVVGDTNHTVVHSSVKAPPKKEKNSNNSKETKEREISAIAPFTPSVSDAENSYSQKTQPTTLEEKPDHIVLGGANPGYRQNEDTHSQQGKPTKNDRHKNAKKAIEQSTLPFEPSGTALTPDEQRVFDLYCKLWFIAVPPKVNETKKKHCGTLAPFVHTWEDMESLEKIARAYLVSIGKGKRVTELGNLVYSLNDWKASREQPANVVQFSPHIHKGSPNAPLLDEQEIKERTAKNLAERKAKLGIA